jgi:hypothetical protein
VVRCGDTLLQVVSYNVSAGELAAEGADVALAFKGPDIAVLRGERP